MEKMENCIEKAMSRKKHPYGIIDPSIIPETADKILDEFFQIAKQLKIRTCLAAGLCLGFVRGGGYIDRDNDLDVVAICSGNKRDKLINSLKEHGFSSGRSFSPPHNNAHFHKNRILVDIFFRKEKRFYFRFESIQYKGKSYFIPSPIKEYLSICYSNWKVKEGETLRYWDG